MFRIKLSFKDLSANLYFFKKTSKRIHCSKFLFFSPIDCSQLLFFRDKCDNESLAFFSCSLIHHINKEKPRDVTRVYMGETVVVQNPSEKV